MRYRRRRRSEGEFIRSERKGGGGEGGIRPELLTAAVCLCVVVAAAGVGLWMAERLVSPFQAGLEERVLCVAGAETGTVLPIGGLRSIVLGAPERHLCASQLQAVMIETERLYYSTSVEYHSGDLNVDLQVAGC